MVLHRRITGDRRCCSASHGKAGGQYSATFDTAPSSISRDGTLDIIASRKREAATSELGILRGREYQSASGRKLNYKYSGRTREKDMRGW